MPTHRAGRPHGAMESMSRFGPLPNVPCRLCGARPPGLLCGLEGRSRETLERTLLTRRFRSGESIFHAGTPVQALYIVRSGLVKVYRLGDRGEEQVIRLLGAGEILGFRPLLAGEPYTASAAAVADSELCIVPPATFLELLDSAPGLVRELLVKLARELRLSEELLMDLTHRPVLQRAASLLCQVLLDSDSLRSLNGHLRRKDMARMIGASPETFSRALRTLAQRGAIRLTRTSITPRDPALLRRLSGHARA